MGMRVRLKAAYDISRFSPAMQVILRAMKKYGMFLADNGSNEWHRLQSVFPWEVVCR